MEWRNSFSEREPSTIKKTSLPTNKLITVVVVLPILIMASLVVVQHKQPSSLLLSSALSDFNGAKLTSSVQFKKRVWQPKGVLHVSASSAKKILIMGGTRFIGLFLSRLLVKEGHQVTLFTRGKAPIAQQLPGESDSDFSDFSSKILHLKGQERL